MLGLALWKRFYLWNDILDVRITLEKVFKELWKLEVQVERILKFGAKGCFLTLIDLHYFLKLLPRVLFIRFETPLVVE